ncbi:MAG TPA: DUF3667 domain-containing protein [Usitatibacter sp.]|nr:DUF3667 domain-containing protein [Usitatibacter sp.]
MSSPALPACRNCGALAGDNFCPRCGQDTKAHPPTAREFLHEFIGHYVAIEGSLWITLKKLAVPGALTLEYLAGRRRRYIHPLRLYLTASVVFFLVAKVFLPTPEVRFVNPASASMGHSVTFIDCRAGEGLCEAIKQRLLDRFGAMTGPKFAEYVTNRLVALFPYAMFLLVPVFALLTRAAYWNRPYNYGEHLVFALHCHAAAFLVGAVAEPTGQALLWIIPTTIYLALALRRVFGGRRWVAIARTAFLFTAYFALIIASMTAIVTATVLL